MSTLEAKFEQCKFKKIYIFYSPITKFRYKKPHK